ncbi:MAG: hypothetical protein WC124_12195 [Desulfoplanes sp.]|jgi:hypothetical protein
MINLTQMATNNDIYIYVDLTSDNIPYETPSFLFGFKNQYTKKWDYVVPNIITQNTRYTVFSIEVTATDFEDQIDGSIALSPSGSWDYSLWATSEPTLDPSNGYKIDEGQMNLISCVDETKFISYASTNESSESSVYLTRDCSNCLTWSTCPDIFSLLVVKWNECN